MLKELYKLAVARVNLRRVVELRKRAGLPQFTPTPLSSLTAKADFIANKKYKPEKNPLTAEEQRRLQKLVDGMSRSSARVVDAHRRGREEVQSALA